jgi:hypothetical protein
MKNIDWSLKICILLLATSFTSKAQLVYLGEDGIQKMYKDGYLSSKRTTGLVTLNGKYYFTTPNGNLYESDGTENNAKSIYHFPPQNIPYLKATKKYVYFGIDNTGRDIKALFRYNPGSGTKIVTLPSKYNGPVELNSIPVNGTKNLVSEIFINYDKDALLIRHFAVDNFYIYKIDDNTDKPEADLVQSYTLDMKNISMPIDIGTAIETFKNEVYFNGKTKPTGVFETSARVFSPSEIDNRKYEYKIGFELLKQKVYPFPGFFRTSNNIYSLFKVVDSTGNSIHRLFYYNAKSISSINAYFEQQVADFAIQKMGEDIYVSCLGNLWKFNEPKSTFEEIIKEKDPATGWDEITKDKRFLRVGNYYLFRRNGKLTMYDAKLRVFKDLTKEELARNYNYFTQHNIYAYEGKNSFYFTQYINDKAVFTKYNPVNNTYTPIDFPQFKKQSFEEIKAIYHEQDKFIFLVSYVDKKDKLVYKMFSYSEEGLPLPTEQPIAKTEVIPTPIIVDKIIDLKKYDKKRFVEQITKIVSNQGNQFEDITGETIPSDFNNKKRSTILLEGFENGEIIDYKKNSHLYRYEAISFKIKGKANALAFLDLLDNEMLKLTANSGIKRIVDFDAKQNKTLHYIFEGKVGYDATQIKFLELQAYCPTNFDNPDDAIFNIFLRFDKPAR